MQIFYNGLHANTQTMIGAASSGSMNNKIPTKVYDLIEAMAINNYERGSDYAKK